MLGTVIFTYSASQRIFAYGTGSRNAMPATQPPASTFSKSKTTRLSASSQTRSPGFNRTLDPAPYPDTADGKEVRPLGGKEVLPLTRTINYPTLSDARISAASDVGNGPYARFDLSNHHPANSNPSEHAHDPDPVNSSAIQAPIGLLNPANRQNLDGPTISPEHP